MQALAKNYDVQAPTGGGIVSYRVNAETEDEAVFKVVTLHRTMGWPLAGEVKALTKDR